MGGIVEDLMWSILVSMTSQSICIITSNSLSLMTLSAVRQKSHCISTEDNNITTLGAQLGADIPGGLWRLRGILGASFTQRVYRGQLHTGLYLHSSKHNRWWLPHERKWGYGKVDYRRAVTITTFCCAIYCTKINCDKRYYCHFKTILFHWLYNYSMTI